MNPKPKPYCITHTEFIITRRIPVNLKDYTPTFMKWVLEGLLTQQLQEPGNINSLVKADLLKVLGSDSDYREMLTLFNARMNHYMGDQRGVFEGIDRDELDNQFADFIDEFTHLSEYIWIIIAG